MSGVESSDWRARYALIWCVYQIEITVAVDQTVYQIDQEKFLVSQFVNNGYGQGRRILRKGKKEGAEIVGMGSRAELVCIQGTNV